MISFAFHCRAIRLFAILACLPTVAESSGFSANFWVWHRETTLDTRETEALRAAGVRRLYWHVGTLRVRNGSWESDGPIRSLPRIDGLDVAPVFRLEATSSSANTNPPALARILARYAVQFSADEIQIDYDCPDRLLADYAALLRVCREEIRPARLSATALAGWIRSSEFPQIAASVDALAPMFYDLEPDSAEDVRDGTLRPLARDTSIREWSACRIPWFAGLPAFARLSLFEPDGSLSGHLRDWRWEELIFHPATRIHPRSTDDVTLLDVLTTGELGSTALKKDQRLALRIPVASSLAAHVETARRFGASGVIWFRLPGAGAQTPLTIEALAALPEVLPHLLELRMDESGRAVLHNRGPSALPPRVAGRHGEHDRGYQLEIDAGAVGDFRGASSGDFVRMAAYRDPDATNPAPGALEASRCLAFWFGELPAGATLRTGAIVLNKAEGYPSNLRWRVDGGEWQVLE